jgi:type I restriction enzyme R subunit
MKFNEDSRVKIPAILHLTRLGYEYVSLKGASWDPSSNIFTDVARISLRRINSASAPEDIERTLQEIGLLLDNEDLGKAFYDRLVSPSGIKLIDFDDFDANSFHVVTELPCIKDDEEFRPDITLLINGLPLVFIEVKKPNNRDGILAERSRINARFQNPKFRRFVNITQLMMFSNNMEYDDSSHEPLQGAFYATTAHEKPEFNYFREEAASAFPQLPPLAAGVETLVLSDTNLHALRHAPEYATNCSPSSPTNRLGTSLFSRPRLAFLLRYGIAYVRGLAGFGKHVMRYPQIFATHAIQTKIEAGIRKGIIWHTQGSGKTALAYYNVRHLTDYFQRKQVVPKFYFIVDRIDLLIQAAREFRSRGLMVHEIDSRGAFTRDIKSKQAIHNYSGKLEITVVNIQKFADDPAVVRPSDYNIQLQRVYFLDEVHRSYNPKGSFLANLNESDPLAIKIGLTGTPLLGDDYNSKQLFGAYIHKYYYNSSIKDGYTLRLIREEIETAYKLQLAKTLEEIEILRGSGNLELIYAHERFVEPMLDYIVRDFENARVMHGDPSIGAMVICDSAAQARKMADLFDAKYSSTKSKLGTVIPFPSLLTEPVQAAAEDQAPYDPPKKQDRAVKSAALILHDVGTKESRKQQIEDFKEGKTDLLFVYGMLLTGFDARRLKKLYLGRLIKAHNLLQALTRVNRTYRAFRYGYVVDFADISAEFEKTNKAYFDELQSELGDEMQHYSDLFKTPEEIKADVDAIKDALWKFDVQNAEVFSQQISEIQDRGQMLAIVKALNTARELYNVIRLSGRYELLESLDFKKLNQLATEAQNHLALLNQKIALEDGHDNTNILNLALENVLFTFRKVTEGELRIADELKEILRKTREVLLGNFNPRDPEFVSLKDELERLFKKKKLSEITQDEMAANITELRDIHGRARELERKNQLLRAKYAHDAKYARVHKRLMEKGDLQAGERKLFEALSAFKAQADAKILQNAQLLNNPAFAEKELLRLAAQQFGPAHGFALDAAKLKALNGLILKEYLDEFHGRIPA